ncbi:MAG: ABC transporter permease, partial [Beijerinckiaceae bacterium]
MFRVLLSRLSQALLVMLAVTAVAFVIFRFVGDPVRSMAREDSTVAERAEMREALGLDRPIVV